MTTFTKRRGWTSAMKHMHSISCVRAAFSAAYQTLTTLKQTREIGSATSQQHGCHQSNVKALGPAPELAHYNGCL